MGTWDRDRGIWVQGTGTGICRLSSGIYARLDLV